MAAVAGLTLRAEFGCWPLWSADGSNVDPAGLSLSAALLQDLDAWVLLYERTLCEEYPPDSGFATEQERAEWDALGGRLAARLSEELSSGLVRYVTDAGVRSK